VGRPGASRQKHIRRGGRGLAPAMKYSSCRTASAGASCNNGGGGAGNTINGEDVLGCWAGVSARS